MKKLLIIALTLMCALSICANVFAQYGVDDSGVGVDSAVDTAASKAPPDTPVMGIGDTLASAYSDFMGQLVSATTGLGSGLTGQFQSIAVLIVTLYVAITGIRALRGDGAPFKEAVTTIALVVIIANIVFNPGNFDNWISGPIIGTIKGVADFLVSKASGGQAGNIINTLAGGMDKIMAACVQLDRIDSWLPTKLLAALVAQIALSVSYLMVIVTFMLISLMTWAGIYLMNVFGAICLFFVCFGSTRHIFWAWLRTMCNYGLVIVFASLVMGVCLKIMGPQLDKLVVMDYGGVHPLLNGPTYTCVAINVLSWCLLLRAPDFAAALSGGSAGNTAGIAGVVSMAAGAAYSGAQWVVAKSASGGFMGQYIGGSPGGGTGGAIARGAGRLAHGLGPSARKGIENSSY